MADEHDSPKTSTREQATSTPAVADKAAADRTATPTAVDVAPAADATFRPSVPSGSGGVLTTFVVAVVLTVILSRLSRRRLAAGLKRWIPLLQVAIWVIAVVVIVTTLPRAMSSPALEITLVVAGLAAVASLGWLRSVMAGAILALEGKFAIGDAVRVGGIDGDIIGFSMRSVRVRGVDGTSHEVPNATMITEAVANMGGESGDAACEIIVPIPQGMSAERALEMAHQTAYLSPMASPRLKPQVFLDTREEGRHRAVRIRGYAFDTAYKDHFRSDVASRLLDLFQMGERGT